MVQLGLASMITVQAAMVAVMTMTPPHMRDHHQAGSSAYVIAVHIAGMYGLAPWVGRFVERIRPIGRSWSPVSCSPRGTAGAVLAGYHRPLIFVGLFLLGLGWNIGLIAGQFAGDQLRHGRRTRRGARHGRPDDELLWRLRRVRLRVHQAGVGVSPLGQRHQPRRAGAWPCYAGEDGFSYREGAYSAR